MAHTCNSSTLGVWGGWITRSRDPDHSGQQGETPSLLKIQKLAGHGGARLQSQLLRRLRQENCLNPGGGCCGELRSRHCTPAWVTRAKLRHKTKNKQTNKKPIQFTFLTTLKYSIQFSNVKYIYNILGKQASRTFSSCRIETWCTLNGSSPLPPSSSPWKPPFHIWVL